MPDWSTACPDWETRITSGQSLIPFAPLFPQEAEAAMQIFRDLKIVDVLNSPTIAESNRDWIFDFASAIFGAYEHDTGRRLIREFMLLISKKNGKSTSAAGIMITALLRNWRQSAEYLILAPTLEVANNSFFPARDMIKADPELAEILKIQENLKTITHLLTGATLKVIAADNDTVSGKKATGVLIDELWLFGKRAHAENMLREATGGLVSRPEGFVVYLSTQSDEAPSGIFRQKLNYFRSVRDGKIIDPRSLPVLYEFPKPMLEAKSYLEPRHFGVTNPNLGLSVDNQWLQDKLTEAQNASEASLNGFLAKHLNIELGGGSTSDAWSGAEDWPFAADLTLTFDELLERSEVIVAGIDGGGSDDLMGLALIGRERGTRDWLVWTHAWCERKVLERRKNIAAQLQDYANEGDLTIVDRLGADIKQMVEIVAKVAAAGLLPETGAVGLDPYGVGAVIDALAAAGIGEDRVQAVSQGFKLQGAILTTERKLSDGSFRHAGRPMMAWCVGNAKIEMRGNAAMITKQASGRAKIDPLMAIFDAVALMSNNPETGGSVYSADRGLVVFG
jgi:phage terminase large subunit-like protein